MTRTNVVLNESLVDKAKNATGLKTIREVVDYALRELLRHERQKDILNLKGNVRWEGNLAEMRKGRQF